MSEWVDFGADEVRFRLPHDDANILCRVTSVALQDYTRAGTVWNHVMALKAFKAHRGEIEAVAKKLLERGELEEDGSVLITFPRIEALYLEV